MVFEQKFHVWPWLVSLMPIFYIAFGRISKVDTGTAAIFTLPAILFVFLYDYYLNNPHTEWNKNVAIMVLWSLCGLIGVGTMNKYAYAAICFFIMYIGFAIFDSRAIVPAVLLGFVLSKRPSKLKLASLLLCGTACVLLYQNYFTTNSFFNGRAELFSYAYDLFEGNPISGVGFDIRWITASNNAVPFSHNFILSTAAQCGIIGLSALSFWIFALLKRVRCENNAVQCWIYSILLWSMVDEPLFSTMAFISLNWILSKNEKSSIGK